MNLNDHLNVDDLLADLEEEFAANQEDGFILTYVHEKEIHFMWLGDATDGFIMATKLNASDDAGTYDAILAMSYAGGVAS